MFRSGAIDWLGYGLLLMLTVFGLVTISVITVIILRLTFELMIVYPRVSFTLTICCILMGFVSSFFGTLGDVANIIARH
jgi:hypothetical protein